MRQEDDGLEVFGVGGLRLADYWESKGAPEAYYGLAVPNFPNYFMFLGTSARAVSRYHETDSAQTMWGDRAKQWRWTCVGLLQ